MMTKVSIHIAIVGRVQGVGFRAWLVRNATALNVIGWGCNCSTGNVEAVLSGAEDCVQAPISRYWSGLSGSLIRGIDIQGYAATAAGPFKMVLDRLQDI